MAFSVAKNRAYFEENIVGQTISHVSKRIFANPPDFKSVFSTWYEVHGMTRHVCIGQSLFTSSADDLREEFGQWIEPKNESDEIGAERFAADNGQKIIVVLKQKYGSYALVLENGCELQSQAGFKEHHDTLIHAGTVW